MRSVIAATARRFFVERQLLIRDALDDLARFVSAERWEAPGSIPTAWAAFAKRR
jgi:hypothetical protein